MHRKPKKKGKPMPEYMPANQLASSIEEAIADVKIDGRTGKLVKDEKVREATEIMERVVKESDVDRLLVGASLINTFNYAIQVQGKRNEWNGKDYQAFCIALAAMDKLAE